MKSCQYNNIAIEQYSNRKGFTLIEIAMMIVVVGVLAAAASMYIKETVDLWRFLSFRSEVVSQGRMSLMRMEREIRQMVKRTPVVEPILTANSSRLRFTAIDLDGDASDDIVEFNLNAARELRRIINDSPALGNILVSNVVSLVFRYYNNRNVELASPVGDTTQIFQIAIELQIQSGDQIKTLRSRVYPRNL